MRTSVGLAQNDLLILCFFLQEGKYHLKRCIDSGLWVPESGEGDDEEDGEEDY